MEEERVPLLVSEPINISDTKLYISGEASSSSRQRVRPIRNYESVERAVRRNPERMIYTWSDISASVTLQTPSIRRWCFRYAEAEPCRQYILCDCEGIAYPGEILAILGPSGSGKTTLLNAITYTPTDDVKFCGVRRINGVQVNEANLRSVSCYVQQDDNFIPTLTVKEHLIFQALVRMDRTLTYKDRLVEVEEVLSEVGLNNCKDDPIGFLDQGGISGGEKKRLAFASEILSNPCIMFCDEPTSGLDSFMALQVVQSLKSMAESGRTIICTIHQPSSEIYLMLDRIMLLSEGKLVFWGDKQQAVDFFQLYSEIPMNYNPADHFIKSVSIIPDYEKSCRAAICDIQAGFQKSLGVNFSKEAKFNKPEDDTTQNIWSSEERGKFYKNSCWAQFRAICWRSWMCFVKDPLLFKVRLFQTIIISLILGLIYFGQEVNQEGVMNINGVIFIFLTSMTFQNVFAVIHAFTTELPIFLRENRNGLYRTDMYFLSKTLTELPFFILLPVIFTSTCYFLIGLDRSFKKFTTACGVVILVANVALSYGYLISCISTNTSMALALGAPLIIPFLLFGGYFMNVNSIPSYFRWLSYLSWFKYANEALMINQWKDVQKINCPVNSTACPTDGHIILETFHFVEEDFVMDIVALCALIIGFRLLAFLALWKKTYTSK